MAATITTPAGKRNAAHRSSPGAVLATRPAPPVLPEAPTSARGGRRYELLGEIATGGMATVHLARLRRPMGFSRLVAIKCMHPQYAKDPDFAAMFVDEARLTARLRHPNIVSTADIVAQQGHLLLVMEYVEGASLSALVRTLQATGERMPVEIACAIIHDVLLGLHAAHEAQDDDGAPLGIIHRDVSPQNVLVGRDGLARVLDFGVAKARSSVHHSVDGEIRGKVPYMAPEQLFGETIGATVDVWSVGVILWEILTGARLFDGNEQSLVHRIANEKAAPPSARGAATSYELDAIVLKALEQDPTSRFGSALEMAERLSSAVRLPPRTEVSAWVKRYVGAREIPRAPICAPDAAVIAAILDGTRPPPSEPDLSNLDTTLSSVSPSSMDVTPVTPRRRSMAALLALPASLVLLAISTFAAVQATNAPATREWRSGAAEAVASAEASAAAPVTSAALTAAPTVVPATTIELPATPASEPATTAKGRRGRSTKPGKVQGAAPAASATTTEPEAAPAKPNCRLPYVVDADGHRHYKVECL